MNRDSELNGDLSIRAVADTTRMEWTQSPSGTVWRKRVHRVGPPESGQVTSIVRYETGAKFPAHDHPEGEEILVLEGVFSDEHGDWPVGTYLLNPEGFRHAPFSVPGCVLFVKLRQFPGSERSHVVIDTHALPWTATSTTGVTRKALYEQRDFSDETCLERWEPGSEVGTLAYEHGAEFFVLEGKFSDEVGTYSAGTWLRLPSGATHRPASSGGCTIYIKKSGLPYLRAESA